MGPKARFEMALNKYAREHRLVQSLQPRRTRTGQWEATAFHTDGSIHRIRFNRGTTETTEIRSAQSPVDEIGLRFNEPNLFGTSSRVHGPRKVSPDPLRRKLNR